MRSPSHLFMYTRSIFWIFQIASARIYLVSSVETVDMVESECSEQHLHMDPDDRSDPSMS